MAESSYSTTASDSEINEAKAKIMALVEKERCGPVLVRLSWHDAGTYDKSSGTGGPRGVMRFRGGEADHGANKGLDIARNLLQPIHDQHPNISTADFWSLAGVAAIEAMGGPKINWKKGRTDAKSATEAAPEGRLPDASKGAPHLRDIFHRMGFNDREIVALSGAHSLGRCHPENSGFDGPWTHTPNKFTNGLFVELTKRHWKPKVNSSGNTQFEDEESKKLMMLPTDMALLDDPVFKPIVEEYAKDQAVFFHDFALAFEKLQSLGVKF